MWPMSAVQKWLVVVGVFAVGVMVGRWLEPGTVLNAQGSNRVFELRTYTAPEGRLNDLQARFRNHTFKLFEKHGITNVGYWVPQDSPISGNTFVYMLAYPNRAEAKKRWAEFQADPDWLAVRKQTEANGPIVTKVESVFMDPADFSPVK
jgi:hypothetical protein